VKKVIAISTICKFIEKSAIGRSSITQSVLFHIEHRSCVVLIMAKCTTWSRDMFRIPYSWLKITSFLSVASLLAHDLANSLKCKTMFAKQCVSTCQPHKEMDTQSVDLQA
jgi:hypothetical protein